LIKNYSIAGIINFIQHGENLFVLWIPWEWLHITYSLRTRLRGKL
jgi:hypothetical protein